MENAVKALTMAAAVFLAIMLIGTLLYVFRQPSTLLSSEAVKEDAKKLQAFNKEYEAFNRNNLYGTDIISVVNKAIDNNLQYPDVPDFQIDVILEIKDNIYKDFITKGIYSNVKELRTKITSGEKANKDEDLYTDFRSFKSTKKFKCTKIDYLDGRVKTLYFEQIT